MTGSRIKTTVTIFIILCVIRKETHRRYILFGRVHNMLLRNITVTLGNIKYSLRPQTNEIPNENR